MNIDDIKRIKNAMTSSNTMDPDTASNMLLGLLLDAYESGKDDRYDAEATGKTIRLFIEGTR